MTSSTTILRLSRDAGSRIIVTAGSAEEYVGERTGRQGRKLADLYRIRPGSRVFVRAPVTPDGALHMGEME